MGCTNFVCLYRGFTKIFYISINFTNTYHRPTPVDNYWRLLYTKKQSKSFQGLCGTYVFCCIMNGVVLQKRPSIYVFVENAFIFSGMDLDHMVLKPRFFRACHSFVPIPVSRPVPVSYRRTWDVTILGMMLQM